jgi:hypothetical protein
MKKVYTVVRKLSQFDILVEDSLMRQRVLQTDKTLNPGDSILTVNGVVIGVTKKEVVQVFNV